MINIITAWMTFDDMEGGNTKRNYNGRGGQYPVKIFTYRKPFGFQFWFFQKSDDHNNRIQSCISLERIWYTKFWNCCNFACYLAVTEENTALASWNFQNCGDVKQTLSFWRQLEITCMGNTIVTDPGGIVRPMWACKRPQIGECRLDKAPNYRRKWLPSEIKSKQTCQKQCCAAQINYNVVFEHNLFQMYNASRQERTYWENCTTRI